MTNNNYLDLVRKMLNAFNNHNMDTFVKYFDEETLDFIPSLKEPLKGRTAIRKDNEEFIKNIPNVHSEMINIFGQDNWVCTHGTVSGTFISTKKSFNVPVCMVIKFDGNTIREIHEYFDQLSFHT